MRKVDEGVSRLLARSEVEQANFASTETNGHLAVERHVGRYELHFIGVVASAFESVNTARHFLRMNLLHDARGFLMGNERGTQCLEYRIPHVMIAVEMTVDHPFNGLVGHLMDAIEEITPVARMGARVDHEYTLFGDEEY